MPSTITHRRGELEDLGKLKFACSLSVTSATLEFNVVGMGHEFWIAVQDMTVVALMVLGRPTSIRRTILYLHVSDDHENLGIGSALIRTVLETYPESEFFVIPFEGTEEVYRQLGFTSKGRWETRKLGRPQSSTST
jgi:ribosomal protein S18 acetylase RimI-like enzyme